MKKQNDKPTIEKIMRLIDTAAYRVDRNKLLSDVFECGAIAISNQFDLWQSEKREKRYNDIISAYQPEERELLAEILSNIFVLLTSMVYDNEKFNDWLGELYMRCCGGNTRNGQFFTPYYVSLMCAKMLIGSKTVKDKAEKDEILTLCEPCCGSGGMVIAALDVLKNDLNFNYARNCFVECADIDLKCVHMCYLQLSLAGVPAIIKHQNTITLELWQVWKTPAFLMQLSRFRKFENIY